MELDEREMEFIRVACRRTRALRESAKQTRIEAEKKMAQRLMEMLSGIDPKKN